MSHLCEFIAYKASLDARQSSVIEIALALKLKCALEP